MHIIVVRGDIMKNTVKFFLGANSNKGFISYFRQLQESDSMQLLILKGGPGSGKSSLMKRIAELALQKRHNLEVIPCASDPLSLDAVIDRTANFAIMDGTAPHTEDPQIPGALHHIMYTGDLWDCDKLREHKEEIIFFKELTEEYHGGAGAYIRSAGALLEENLRVSKKYINSRRISEYAKDILKKSKKGAEFSEKTRLLSAVSVGEIKFFKETVLSMADKIYAINDEWGGMSDTLFKAILFYARASGEEIIHCPCSIMPEKTDHIILPGSKTAFLLENRFFPVEHGEKIKAEAFYTSGIDKTVMEKRSQDAQKLLSKAANMVKTAKRSHDRLERFYVNAMDFEKTELLFEKIKTDFYS